MKLSERNRALVESEVGPYFANDPPAWLERLLNAARQQGPAAEPINAGNTLANAEQREVGADSKDTPIEPQHLACEQCGAKTMAMCDCSLPSQFQQRAAEASDTPLVCHSVFAAEASEGVEQSLTCIDEARASANRVGNRWRKISDTELVLIRNTIVSLSALQAGGQAVGLPDDTKAREFGERVYAETGGPSPEMRRLYGELRANEARGQAGGAPRPGSAPPFPDDDVLACPYPGQAGGVEAQERDIEKLSARDLSDAELRAEQTRVEKLWDSMFEPDEDGEVFEGRGGSPGEWMQERMDEMATEQLRRAALSPPAEGEL